MPQYYSSLGNGSSGFIANGPMTISGGWMSTTSTVVTINDQQVDMTDAEVGEERRVDGFIVVRTERGVKARSRR